MKTCHINLTPLGARWDSAGVNLRFSANANQVKLLAGGMELNEECWNNGESCCVGLRPAETLSRN